MLLATGPPSAPTARQEHWSRKFPKREKLLRCLQAAWAAWIIDPKSPKNFGAKPRPKMNYSSRVRNDPAVLLFSNCHSERSRGIPLANRQSRPYVCYLTIAASIDRAVRPLPSAPTKHKSSLYESPHSNEQGRAANMARGLLVQQHCDFGAPASAYCSVRSPT